MKILRTCFLTACAICLIGFWGPPADAGLSLSTSWERPVTFKLVDAESSAPLDEALLIIKTEKRAEGSTEPVYFYDVVKGPTTGLIDYRVSEKTPGAEIRVVRHGYALLTQKLLWQSLPARKLDSSGLDIDAPVIALPAKPLSEEKGWLREFRFVIAPELEDLLQVQPPFLSRDEQRTIDEFLNRERDRLLGL
jgi:hypothetical protein